MSSDKVASAIERGLISPNVCDSNWESANVVDVLNYIAISGNRIARAITPEAAPYKSSDGGVVNSLTEAVILHAEAMKEVASALNNVADAISEGRAAQCS